MRISPQEQRTRLAFDWRVAFRMQNEIVSIEPFASVTDATAGRLLPVPACEAGNATVYIATYRLRMLDEAYKPLDEARVLFNLLAGPSYPQSRPSAQVISRPIPFGPHIAPGSGSICLGEGWANAGGQMLAGELVSFVARLLNFDEYNAMSLDGYNSTALSYWRDVLGAKPLTPRLRYPTVPEDLVYGIPRASILKRKTVGGSGLRRIT